MCPSFAASLVNAIDELMLGKQGRPRTLVETITWMANQVVVPTHPIGKAFESACKDCETPETCFLQLLQNPQQLKIELEELLSPGLVTFSTSVEHALLGQLQWSQLPLEFLVVWVIGRNRWVVESADPVDVQGFKRVIFKVRNPVGSPLILVTAAGETDEEAEEQGRKAYEEYAQSSTENILTYIVTISTENKGTFKKGDPGFLQLHYLANFLMGRA